MSCRRLRALLVPLLLGVAGCGAGDVDGPLVQWHLPDRLKEVSGLALAPDGRLFAVADERAVVVEMDWARGAEVARTRVGDPVLRGDFEGIAVLGEQLYLVTSDGVLYSLQVPAPGADRRMDAVMVQTGAGERCEVEGLEADPQVHRLLLACKTLRGDGPRDRVQVYAWQLPAGPLELVLDLPEETLADLVDRKGFNPSGISLVADELWLVAARQAALARLTRTGQVLAVARLDKDRHRQTEGIAVAPGGDLLLADEGKKGRARLSRYRPAAVAQLWGTGG